MAKESKRSNVFGAKPESFGESRRKAADTHEYTHISIHDSVQEPVAREKKGRRVQLLTYATLIDRVDAYARKKDVSRVEVIEAAIRHFLDGVEE